jgi:hypothetical protein
MGKRLVHGIRKKTPTFSNIRLQPSSSKITNSSSNQSNLNVGENLHKLRILMYKKL